jgi:hypothetical protein
VRGEPNFFVFCGSTGPVFDSFSLFFIFLGVGAALGRFFLCFFFNYFWCGAVGARSMGRFFFFLKRKGPG